MRINPAPESNVVGGKAFQLARLKEFCRVPPFFVVTFDDPAELEDPSCRDSLAEHCRALQLDPVAVRSSAPGEDSARASFAGLFETVLNVHPHQLAEAARRVLGSAGSGRVKDYCEAVGFDFEPLRMAVLIQQMVRARVAGVCLTRLGAGGESLFVEACLGLGEGLVSGEVVPDTYVVGRETLAVERETISTQELFLTATDDGPPAYRQVPAHLQGSRKLSDEELREVSQTCLAVERRLGLEPADVEWAYQADTLYILQARPGGVPPDLNPFCESG